MFKRSRVRSWVAVLLTFFFVVGLFPNTITEAWAAAEIKITGISPAAGSENGCNITIYGTGFNRLDRDHLDITLIIDGTLIPATLLSCGSDKIYARTPSVPEVLMGESDEKDALITLKAPILYSDPPVNYENSIEFLIKADPVISEVTINTDIHLIRNIEGHVIGRDEETQFVLKGARLNHDIKSLYIGEAGQERPVEVPADIRYRDYSRLAAKLPDGLQTGVPTKTRLETIYGGIAIKGGVVLY
ncbi:MAG: hypothetical protein GX755_04165, partial [Syntrophomonadaceae bacterium]|nr:hypothetical protein [Syntrophomonadaceae bacterium]